MPEPMEEEATSETLENTAQKLYQFCEDINTFACSTVDANFRSVSAAAKGWDEGSQNAGQLLQENISRAMNTSKTIAEAKSIRDVMALQQEFFRDCVDLWMSGAAKLSEISARTAKDIVGPVAQHTNESVNRLMQKAKRAA